jgi:hypothetical protein
MMFSFFSLGHEKDEKILGGDDQISRTTHTHTQEKVASLASASAFAGDVRELGRAGF